MAPILISGAETGALVGPVGGDVTVSTAVANNGSKSFRFNGVASSASMTYTPPAGNTVIVGRIYVYYATLPAIDNEVLWVTLASANAVGIKLRAADRRFFVRFWSTADGNAVSTVITAGTWYRIDYKINVGGASTLVDFQVNGVAATQSSQAWAASTIYQSNYGASNPDTFLFYEDDLALSVTAADYPIGTGSIETPPSAGGGASSSGMSQRKLAPGGSRARVLSLTSPTVTAQNTTVTNALGPDGVTWAQGHPMIVDKFGKFIAVEQQGTGGPSFVWSNNGGATWADGLNQAFITRGSITYDSTNDIIHVLWLGSSATDGMIYRRYTITRDGSNNITAVVRDTNVNLQVDFQTGTAVEYEHPIALWLSDAAYGTYGALLLIWGIGQSGAAANGSEIRASMRILTNTVADNTAANWISPTGANSTSTISQAPAVPYAAIDTSTGTATPYVSAARKRGGSHAGDLYFSYALFVTGAYTYYARRATWNAGASRWSGGMTARTLISAVVRSGTNAGYSLKHQLMTEPREDATGDRMIVGLATWKDNTAGDSWGFVAINSADAVSAITDVYTAGASANSSNTFITGDVAAYAGNVIVTYTNLPNKDALITAYDKKGVQVVSPITLFNTLPVDIPTIYQDGTTVLYGSNPAQVLVIFRDFNVGARGTTPTYSGGPYKGYLATVNAKLV